MVETMKINFMMSILSTKERIGNSKRQKLDTNASRTEHLHTTIEHFHQIQQTQHPNPRNRVQFLNIFRKTVKEQKAWAETTVAFTMNEGDGNYI